MGYCFCIYPPAHDVSVHGISFRTKLDMLPWTSFMSDLLSKLRIINRSVPGLATDATCHPHVLVVLFKFYGLKGQLVYLFGIVEINFLLIFSLWSRCDMAFIEPMHYNEPNITYLLAFVLVFTHYPSLNHYYSSQKTFILSTLYVSYPIDVVSSSF